MKWLLPPVLFLICLIAMALLRWLWPIAMIFPGSMNLAGVVPIILGMATGGTGAFKFVKERTNIHPFQEADKLVTEGMFRYSRNPMYLSLLLILIGTWILLRALSPVVVLPIFVMVSNRLYIAYEEKMLSDKFGREYEDYKKRVRRWI